MTRRLARALVLAVVVALAAAAGAIAQAPSFEPAQDAAFPNRVYRVTLPKQQALTTSRVSVTENGEPVDSLYVTAPGVGGTKVGTVLLIDTSNSMAGRPIEGALAAAQAFAARRNPNQQLAVIGFDGAVDTLLGFTTSGQEIDAVLAQRPVLAEGTHIYDGIQEALDLIRANGLERASIVLLSDGADVGSGTSRDEVLERLDGGDVRVFSVGLRSGSYDPTSLTALAEVSGGAYREATSTAQLAGIFDAIGYKLANEYEVRWRSLVGPETPVDVRIEVAGFDQPYTTSYTSPALPAPGDATFRRTLSDRVLQSWILMLAVVAVAVLLVGYAVATMIQRPDERLRERIGDYVTIRSDEDVARLRREELARLVSTKGEKSLFGGTRWFTSLEHDLDLTDLKLSASAVVALTAAGTLMLMLLFAAMLDSLFGALIGLVAGPLIARAILKALVARRRRAFAEQLPDNLDVLASALRAGHSLGGAMAVMVNDAGEPSQSEFRRVLADEQLGIPLDEALEVTVRRMASRDLDQVAIVAALQRDTGGNSAEVLDQVAENIRGRMELRRLIRVLTAQGRLARWIVSLLPVALFFGIYLMNDEYLQPLWQETIGKVLMVVAGVMIVSGSLVIKRIVDIRV